MVGDLGALRLQGFKPRTPNPAQGLRKFRVYGL